MKLRKVGDILLDLEPILQELAIDHELQYGDILNLVYGYLKVHCIGAEEEYEDGTHPIFYYGPNKE